jgi:predicted DNA binding protein
VSSCDYRNLTYSASDFFLMSLVEVVFKVTHDYLWCNISKRFSMAKMFVWCNREHEAIEMIAEKQHEYSAVKQELSKIGETVEEKSNSHQVHIVMKTCSCHHENSVTKHIDAFNILRVSPVIYEQGWEYYCCGVQTQRLRGTFANA